MARVVEYLRHYWHLLVVGLWLPRTTEGEKQKRRRSIARSRDDSKHVEEAGRWYFKRDILDRLQEYFYCIGRMRRYDPAAFHLYSRLGAVIISQKSLATHSYKGSFVSMRGHKRIGFGAIAILGVDEDIDQIPVSFQYFTKCKTPPAKVQPAEGDIYAMTVFYVDKKKGGHMTMPIRYHVAVDRRGRAVLLKELCTSKQTIRAKDSQEYKRYGNIKVEHQYWSYPPYFIRVCEDPGHKPVKPEEFGPEAFYITYEGYIEASMDVRIRVQKGKRVGMFSVDLLRMPYFFDERETSYTESGAKKRIFHIVRTHPRRLKDGRTIHVHSHFRGERSFIWHGYQVNITMPGKHHVDLLQFDVGSHDFEEGTPIPPGMMGIKKMAKGLDHHVNV